MQPTAHVPLPDLVMEEGTPCSALFDDVYFSRDGGIDETTHVFIRGNRLPERWTGRERFTIGELGFGTGLNFLVAWQTFMETSAPHQRLHYCAIEQFPLTLPMLRAALAQQPELADFATQLIAAYPLRLPGLHRLQFGRVSLTLYIGDAAPMLQQFTAPIDAWFLDGFTPAKNPGMWSEEVMQGIGRASAADATLATFTAARAVKEGLQAQGFAMTKVDGYGHKRNMLVGARSGAVVASSKPRTALVIGAGIAGCSLARALAERGLAVTVLERHRLADGASGNDAGVLFPPLPKRWTRAADFYFTALSFMLQHVRHWPSDLYQQPGLLRLPRHAEEEAQLQQLNAQLGLDDSIVHWLPREQASAQAGIELQTGASFLPRGTWIAPTKACKFLLQHARITLHEHTAVTAITREGDGWVAHTADGRTFRADQLCLATATDTAALLPEMPLRLNAVAGQVSVIPASESGPMLRSILCHKGYVIPLGDHHLIGATYDHNDFSRAVTAANHEANVAEIETILPGWLRTTPTQGRTSLRATTPDRLPYIGALAPGLWLSTGHGSRGMLSGPMGAEIIASAMLGEPSPVSTALRDAVNPRRFG